MAGSLFLTILSVMSAVSVVRVDGVMEDRGLSNDGEEFDELDDAPIVIVDDDGEEDDDSLEENGSTDDADENWKEEDYEKMHHRDYVEIPRSTNELVHSYPLNTSPNGTMNIVVDILAVVDNKLYIKFLSNHKSNANETKVAIKKYYRHFYREVNARYSGINDSELSIRIRLVGVFIAQKNSSSPWSRDHFRRDFGYDCLDPNVGIKQFKNWLLKRNGTLPKYDHAMAFTGYKLIDRREEHYAGMAYEASNCDFEKGYMCSLIKEELGFLSAHTAIHELAHAIGARHDGASPNEDCPASKTYIMAPTDFYNDALRKNFFLFSACTIRSFKSVLRSMNITCLLDSSADKIPVLPGQAFSPDYQCKDFYGQKSGFCHEQNNSWPRPDRFCSTLWCTDPRLENECRRRNPLVTPLLGSPCADGKVCKNGECLNETEVVESMKEVGASTTYTKLNSVDLNEKRTHG